jgi:hypothetical protein
MVRDALKSLQSVAAAKAFCVCEKTFRKLPVAVEVFHF